MHLGELSKPATVLVEKISDAIGGYFRPYQIRRLAKAEADADKIKAAAQLDISELQQRALRRFISEEARKQDNIEGITAKALPLVGHAADPSTMDDDWIANFFDKGRLISDEEMQILWARILAGEANTPNKFSKRTVNYLSSLDKSDAELFRTLCGYACTIDDVTFPAIYDLQASPYNVGGINFGAIKHLDDIGLLRFDNLSGFVLKDLPQTVRLSYEGIPIDLAFPMAADNTLQVGKVLLTKVGEELATVCGSRHVEGFVDYLVEQWSEDGIACSSPLAHAFDG